MTEDYPVDNEKTIYFSSGCGQESLQYIIDRAREHFGYDVSLDDLSIEAEYRHVRCIGYDLYDAGDYQNYIVITRI